MRLYFTSGSRAGEVIDLARPQLTIGRLTDNDVVLADENVSRHHAVIELGSDGRVLLRDLGSQNGTFVDAVRLSDPLVLVGGERLRFGDQEVRVEQVQTPGADDAVRPGGSSGDAGGPTAGGRVTGLRRRIAALGIRGGALGGVVVVVLTIGAAQLVLPGLAKRSLRSDLERYGQVQQVSIEALPAIKLLWHRADRVVVVMNTYRSLSSSSGASLADFLSRTRATPRLDARVGVLQARRLTLRDVRLRKDGDALVGEARLTQQDVRAALPTFVDVRPVEASDNGIVLQVRASVLGRTIALRVRVLADAGRVVVRPEGLPFASVAKISVFSDPRVYVDSLGAQLRGDQYFLVARASLR